MKKQKVILNAIKTPLSNSLGEKIKHVILFGSRAWGGAKRYSDYDLLVVLAVENDWQLREQVSEILYDIDLTYHIYTQPLVISEEEINHSLRGAQPIIQKALQNGIYA
jgi:predicted nucleotidyltransferase